MRLREFEKNFEEEEIAREEGYGYREHHPSGSRFSSEINRQSRDNEPSEDLGPLSDADSDLLEQVVN